jgi:diadenosine tetraphosphate (Ap4A) HIT family hydrolase
MESNKNYVNLDNARKKDQEESMKRIQERKECPFCWENLEKEHKEEILKEGKFWLITKNQWKYEEADLHLLLISKEHAESFRDLKPGAGDELLEFLQWAEEKFSLNSGGVCMRFGDINYNGATVSHFHIHLMKPKNPLDDDYKPIRFRIGGRIKEKE